MANPVKLLEARRVAANDVLKRKKVGVTIYIKKDAFVLRASLPSKDPQSKQNIQQWVSIGIKAEEKNRNEAIRLAEKLGEEKKAGLFRWDKWKSKEEEETIVLKPVSKKVGDIIKRYEKDFWSKEGRNKTDEANQQYWYQIQHYVNKIEKHKLLSVENIFELGNTFPKASKKKADFAKYCLLVGKFAEISNLRKLQAWANAAQKAYNTDLEARARERLTDEEYLEVVRALRNDVHTVRVRQDKSTLPAQREWGWALAAQFVFGARTSEVWSIQPFEKDGQILAKILTVEKNKKPTKWRVAGALKQEWARELNILEVNKIHSINTASEYDAKVLKTINNTYSKWLKQKSNAAFEPYQLRHAFGYRTGNMNINTGVASKWMGHSEATHTSTYKKAYDESDAIKTLKLLRQQEQQQ